MKKFLSILLSLISLVPVVAFATTTIPWTLPTNEDFIRPNLVSGTNPNVLVGNATTSLTAGGTVLDVEGSQYVQGNLGVGSLNPGYTIDVGNDSGGNIGINGFLYASYANAGGIRIGDIGPYTGTYVANGDTIFSNNAGTFHWTQDGVNREDLTLLSNGNLGVGTTSPYLLFSVGGDMIATGTITSLDYQGNTVVGAGFSVGGPNNTNIGLNNQTANNGTTAVGNGNISTGNFFSTVFGRGNWTNETNGYLFGGGNTALNASASYLFGVGNTANNVDTGVLFGINNVATANNATVFGAGITNNIAGSLMLGPSDTAKLTILSTGNTGIGTTSPGTIFSLGDTGANTININSIATSTFGSGLNIRTGCYAINGVCISGGSGSSQWTTSGNNIYNNNVSNVGIGTTSPFSMLSVSTSTASSPSTSLFAVASSTNATLFNVLGNGNVGISSTSPQNSLDVAGFINTTKFFGYKQENIVILTASSTNLSTAVGQGSLVSNLASGLKNTGVGSSTLNKNTTGSNNTAVGAGALFSNTVHSDNVAVGSRALFTNTGGGNLVAVGSEALLKNTSGFDNIALGYQSGFNQTTGNTNTSIGTQALFSNTSNNNIAIGYQSNGLNTTGDKNITIGNNTFSSNITGRQNVIIGDNNYIGNFAPTSTVAIGASIEGGSFVTSDIGNTLIGYGIAFSATQGSNYNTIIGYLAGTNLTSGSNNVIIANATSSSAVANITTGSQNILIGNNISIPSATGNNQLDIGNIIYGTGINGVGSTLSTGNIGIGTTTPNYPLSVFSATGGQLALSAGSGINQWVMRTLSNGDLVFASTTVAGTATTSTSAMTLSATGVPSILVGSTTCMTTLKNGSLCLGGSGDSGGTTGSTTITTGIYQIDALNSAGGRICMFVVGTTMTIVSGPCTP